MRGFVSPPPPKVTTGHKGVDWSLPIEMVTFWHTFHLHSELAWCGGAKHRGRGANKWGGGLAPCTPFILTTDYLLFMCKNAQESVDYYRRVAANASRLVWPLQSVVSMCPARRRWYWRLARSLATVLCWEPSEAATEGCCMCSMLCIILRLSPSELWSTVSSRTSEPFTTGLDTGFLKRSLIKRFLHKYKNYQYMDTHNNMLCHSVDLSHLRTRGGGTSEKIISSFSLA